jgi:hypothetical protein
VAWARRGNKPVEKPASNNKNPIVFINFNFSVLKQSIHTRLI